MSKHIVPQNLQVLKLCVQGKIHYKQKEKVGTLTQAGISAARHIGLAVSRTVSTDCHVGAFSINATQATFFTTAIIAQIPNPLVLNSSCITIDTSMETLLRSQNDKVQLQGVETILCMMDALASNARSIIFVADEWLCCMLAKRILNILGDTQRVSDHRFNKTPGRATFDLYFNKGRLVDLRFTKELKGCLEEDLC